MIDKELDTYFSDRLLDLLEKLNIKSARPRDVNEVIRRVLTAVPAAFDDAGLESPLRDLDKELKRIR